MPRTPKAGMWHPELPATFLCHPGDILGAGGPGDRREVLARGQREAELQEMLRQVVITGILVLFAIALIY